MSHPNSLQQLNSIWNDTSPMLTGGNWMYKKEVTNFLDINKNYIFNPNYMKPGAFVTIINPKYINDYGQIIDIDWNKGKALIKLIPRINYQDIRAFKVKTQTSLNSILGPNAKIPLSLFEPDFYVSEQKKVKIKISWAKNGYIDAVKWDGDKYIGKFLYKRFYICEIKLIDTKIPDKIFKLFTSNIAEFEALNQEFMKKVREFEEKNEEYSDIESSDSNYEIDENDFLHRNFLMLEKNFETDIQKLKSKSNEKEKEKEKNEKEEKERELIMKTSEILRKQSLLFPPENKPLNYQNIPNSNKPLNYQINPVQPVNYVNQLPKRSSQRLKTAMNQIIQNSIKPKTNQNLINLNSNLIQYANVMSQKNATEAKLSMILNSDYMKNMYNKAKYETNPRFQNSLQNQNQQQQQNLNQMNLQHLNSFQNKLQQPNMNQNNLSQPKINLNQPSMSQNQPKINLNQSSMSQNQPKINLNQSSMSQNQPKINLNQSSMSQNQPKINSIQPRINLNQPSMSQNQPKISAIQPKINMNQTNMNQMNLDQTTISPIQQNINLNQNQLKIGLQRPNTNPNNLAVNFGQSSMNQMSQNNSNMSQMMQSNALQPGTNRVSLSQPNPNPDQIKFSQSSMNQMNMNVSNSAALTPIIPKINKKSDKPSTAGSDLALLPLAADSNSSAATSQANSSRAIKMPKINLKSNSSSSSSNTNEFSKSLAAHKNNFNSNGTDQTKLVNSQSNEVMSYSIKPATNILDDLFTTEKLKPKPKPKPPRINVHEKQEKMIGKENRPNSPTKLKPPRINLFKKDKTEALETKSAAIDQMTSFDDKIKSKYDFCDLRFNENPNKIGRSSLKDYYLNISQYEKMSMGPYYQDTCYWPREEYDLRDFIHVKIDKYDELNENDDLHQYDQLL